MNLKALLLNLVSPFLLRGFTAVADYYCEVWKLPKGQALIVDGEFVIRWVGERGRVVFWFPQSDDLSMQYENGNLCAVSIGRRPHTTPGLVYWAFEPVGDLRHGRPTLVH